MSVHLLRSKRLVAPHGFPLRMGGVSPAPFDALNLGGSTGDDPSHVEENLRRLAAAGGFPLGRLHAVAQVHGDRVVEAPVGEDSDALRPAFTEADGVWTAVAGEVVGVRIADCVPLLLEGPGGRTVAAVHSGWRGTDAGIAARAVEALTRAGVAASGLRACVGPHIRACCYEVSAELADRFRASFGEEIVRSGPRGLPHLDLAAAVVQTLLGAGVPESQVDVLPACTACTPGFFSHRRDGGRTGRHLAFIRAA